MPPASTTGQRAHATSSEASLMDAFDAALPGISPGVFDAADFRAIAEIAHKEAGIVLPEGKAMLVFARLSPLVRNTNCATFASYVIRIREDVAERRRAICALTASRATFYQHPHQFEHFAHTVRPGYVERLLSGGKVRLWSAGCASGADAWALLITLLGDDVAQGEALAKADLRLLGTDIATPAIATARAATYRTEDLKPLPAPLRQAWTHAHGEHSTIAPQIQQLTRFRAHNLLDEWPMQGQFDTIFCRTALRHFDDAARERLVLRLAEQLTPGGWLYLGDGDVVSAAAGEVLLQAGPATYQKQTT
ncbi:CheR family methyltransferase [Novosphingobium sp.]|uniref:CheR family methyltransferase n=1 Tax=Novosphingobium sp. TaxID=1874826 RepID=UPI002615D88F|nr:CheR family methyltransferase [Novosphingobium sp.]